MDRGGVLNDLEHAHLSLEIEPVARLGFDGRRAVEQEPVEAAKGRVEELF